MHFIVHALDKPDALQRRLDVIDAHRAYLAEARPRHSAKILMSGPLIDDQTQEMKGSFFLIDAPDRTDVEDLFAGDPLAGANVWETCTVTAFHLRTSVLEQQSMN